MAAAKQETQIETVVMSDGRTVDFAGKRKMLKESFVNGEGSVSVRLDFRNAETRTFTIPGTMMAKFAAHGAEQKLGDEIAGVDDVDDCVIGMDELIERLGRGEWGVKRESNGLAGTSVLVRALVEHYKNAKTVEQIKTFLSDKSHAQKTALRTNPAIKPIIERLEAEKAAKKAGNGVDTDALLAELG